VGSHEQLMQKLGTYRRLYDLQFINLHSTKVGAQA
jgi:ABC-type multidrug transport system fused ATPase/permease subunit